MGVCGGELDVFLSLFSFFPPLPFLIAVLFHLGSRVHRSALLSSLPARDGWKEKKMAVQLLGH